MSKRTPPKGGAAAKAGRVPSQAKKKPPSARGKGTRAAGDNALGEVEARLGYRFSDPSLLKQALTHRSYSQEVSPPEEDNERLEFLGDAVLQLIVTERLWRDFPALSEGHLTRRRSERVSGYALARVSRQIGLPEHLRLGKGEEKTGGRKKASIRAGAFEALVGAIYLDAGYGPCAEWVESWLWRPEMEGDPSVADYKSQLQEAFQRRRKKLPLYRVVSETGPEHQKLFRVEVRHEGKVLGEGTGPTKKAAEQAAAREALGRLGAKRPE